MKILLDECITTRFKKFILNHDVFTVYKMGLSGIKNGNLMKYCIDNHFDIILTIDKNMMFQQNLKNYPISIVVLNSKSSKIEELINFLPNFEKTVPSFEKSKSYILDL